MFLFSENSDEEFGIIQPSLIRQLRKILDEYPDGGQILKVLYIVGILIVIYGWS